MYKRQLEIFDKHDVGALAGRNAAQIVVHREAGRAIDGAHLDSGDGVDALLHRTPDEVVEMPLLDERIGMVVVGHEHGEAAVDLAVGDHGRKRRQVDVYKRQSY